MKSVRRFLMSVTTGVAAVACAVSMAPAAQAAVNPVLAGPYLYQWGSPIPNPVSVMNSTGVKSFTLAFILSDGGCNPKWDGDRALTGADATRIQQIRSAGGDIVPSFGGWSGNKLGEHCSSATALAGAYQKVIDAYKLKAIDIDIENTEFTNNTVQDRVLGALKIVEQKNAGITTVVTMGTATSGPDATGTRLINRAKALGVPVDVWSIMPFDFSSGGDMAAHTKSAAEGLKGKLKTAFGWSDSVAYSHMGISSMNGKTDNAGETVTLANFKTIAAYATTNHLARLTFWAVNRDRGGCGSASTDSCSGVSQGTYDFTKVVAGFKG
jgi:hypothetical protein